MSDLLCKLIGLGNDIGTVVSAHMYDSGVISVEGMTAGERKFDITFCVKEEKKDDNA